MRSYLFVPGDSERKLAKGLESGADALLIDLEDSVALDNKKTARKLTREFLDSAVRGVAPLLFVRVNALDTGTTDGDLAAILGGKPHGILLPKSNHGEDVTQLDAMLNVHEARAGVDEGSTRILAIITETASGVLNAGTFAQRSARLDGVAWGAEDLSADVGALQKRHDDGRYRDTFRHARTQTLLGAVAAGVQPIDTVYTDFKNESGLREECSEAATDGFTGKMAIHPAQVPVINEAFTPSAEAVARARLIVDTFEKAGNPGVVGLDGEMLDRPHLRAAERVLAWAGR